MILYRLELYPGPAGGSVGLDSRPERAVDHLHTRARQIDGIVWASALLIEVTENEEGHALEHVAARYRVTDDGRVMVSRYPAPRTTAERESEPR